MNLPRAVVAVYNGYDCLFCEASLGIDTQCLVYSAQERDEHEFGLAIAVLPVGVPEWT